MHERYEPLRDEEFWIEELQKAGFRDKLPSFKHVGSGTDRLPSYYVPIERDALVGGKHVDVYYMG